MKTGDDILAACERAEKLAPKKYPPTLPAKKELLGAPEWYAFEHEAWPIGEKIRQDLAATPRLRKDEAIQERIVQVIENRNLRRGRQSFVMAISHSAAATNGKRLVPFLTDPDIGGHVVDALLKMKAFQYADAVRPLLGSDNTWIRKKAQRYIEQAK